MNTQKLVATLSTKKNGSWFNMRWVSDVKLSASAKKMGVTAYKITEAQVRKGINYTHQKSVQMKVESGEKQLTHELPWGNWKEGYDNLIIEHKGNDYVRLYLGANNPKVKYVLNGKEVTKKELQESGYVLKSYFTESTEKPDALTVKVANVEAIS